MSNEDSGPIAIILSPTQVDDVVRAASNSRAPSISTLIAGSLRAPLGVAGDAPDVRDGARVDDRPSMPACLPGDTNDPRLSRSLLRGLSILTCFGPLGEERGIVELANALGMSASTAHRYAMTLVELGLLERSPRTRKYRLPGT